MYESGQFSSTNREWHMYPTRGSLSPKRWIDRAVRNVCQTCSVPSFRRPGCSASPNLEGNLVLVARHSKFSSIKPITCCASGTVSTMSHCKKDCIGTFVVTNCSLNKVQRNNARNAKHRSFLRFHLRVDMIAAADVGGTFDVSFIMEGRRRED